MLHPTYDEAEYRRVCDAVIRLREQPGVRLTRLYFTWEHAQKIGLDQQFKPPPMASHIATFESPLMPREVTFWGVPVTIRERDA